MDSIHARCEHVSAIFNLALVGNACNNCYEPHHRNIGADGDVRQNYNNVNTGIIKYNKYEWRAMEERCKNE